MGQINSYRDLEVWQVAMDLADAVYDLTRDFPDDERFGLTQQIRRAAVSIPSNIAEGHGRMHGKEFMRFLRIANGSLKELETQLILAGRREYMTRDAAQPIWEMTQRCGKMLRALIKSLDKTP